MKIASNQLNIKDLDNISVTAYRILSILNLLLEGPCSDQDINDKLQQDILGARSLSQDTIYIYMNTLRSLGCEITRPSKNTGYKYVMKNNPFKIKLSEQEVTAIVKTRKYANTHDNWKLNIKFDQIQKLIDEKYFHTDTIKLIEQIEKSMIQKRKSNIKYHLIKTLEKYCAKNWSLLITYNSPVSGEKLIKIRAENLSFENSAYYLWGYNLDLRENQYLRVDRIKEIKGINIKTECESDNFYSVTVCLSGKSSLVFVPAKDESLIKKDGNGLVVEIKNKSKFKLIQTILSYGPDCTVLSPDEVKEEVITALKLAHDNYS